MPSLSRVEADERAQKVRVDEYEIDLDLRGGPDTFATVTTIRFGCLEPDGETFVELKPLTLHEARLNGTPLDPGGLVDNRFALTGLREWNELVVTATMAYSRTGEGLHRFVDPEDGETYCYAQTFLDDAQRVFACFDQPDLKAPVILRVSAPAEWEVAGNAVGTLVGPGRWEFEPTRPLATYLVTLLAGPYHVRRDEHDGIPLVNYCRRSLAPHLDKDLDEIVGLTKSFLDRFHSLFGVRYPFGQYGQAFVPEFNAGAMENPGLVMFRDEYLFRSAVTDVERELRAVTIAHEMAHMWFGDLVTMRWWDDLWLNESFAEYLGVRVTAEASRFVDAWTGFAVARKGWGYAADQRPSTHPVAPESVVDTAHALLNFDGISYAKGASVLRQLVVFIGDEAFLAGLTSYFGTYAYGNATLADLLAELAASSGRDLGPWAEVWLRRSQVNTLRPEVTFGPAGDYDTVHIVQSVPPTGPTLRPHRLGVGVYRSGQLQHRMMVDLDPTHPRTAVPELTGVTAGDLLLLNDGDLTYAKIRFDPASHAAVTSTLPKLVDPLARALVWAATIDAVVDAEVSVADLLSLVSAGLPTETAVSLVRDLTRFTTCQAADAVSLQGGLLGRFLPPSALPAAEQLVARAFRARLESAPPGDGLALAALRGFLAAAGPDDVAEIRGWLDQGAPAGLEMDADLRWATVARLVSLGEVDQAMIDAEADRDRTASGAVNAARCRAARPDPDAKAAAWLTLTEDTSLSNRQVVAAAEGFWDPRHLDLTSSYVERFFADMPAVARRRTPPVLVHVALAAFPRYAVHPATAERALEFLGQSDVDPVLRRVVVDWTDELERALAGRAVWARGTR
jgi:aminopeptidase N